MKSKTGGNNQRLAIMLGMLTKDQKIKANIPKKDRSNFSQEKYKFLLFAPFEISNKCCTVFKKSPAHTYYREHKLAPITAQMAAESKLRTQKWMQNGCNGFDLKIPTSNPMAFWTEQDILEYVKQYNLEIASVYGSITDDLERIGEIEGQLTFSDVCCSDCYDAEKPPLKTTGCKRTGCCMCGFGVHINRDSKRFLELAETHPKIADFCLRGGAFDENGLWKPTADGLGFWFVMAYLNEYGNFAIKIPNYEHYRRTYGNETTEKYLKKEISWTMRL